MIAGRRVWLPGRLSEEQARLKNELLDSLVKPEAAPELRGYVEDSFQRLLTTLELTPPGPGRVLELGANPYFFTMLLQRFREYELVLANFFGGRGTAVQHVVNLATGERRAYSYDEFNIEEDDFPYPDERFDGVIYAEILEHLVRDPVGVLAEIHRVLRPDGWLLITTPNVARRQNALRLLRGDNIYDPYSGYGPYGRHNREYTAGELRDLLEGTGFTVERLITRDLHPCSRRSKLLALVLGPESGDNLYAMARRSPDFRWHYPPWLFRSGLPSRPPRDSFFRAGVNDAVQARSGWWEAEHWPDGVWARWTRERAVLALRARGGEGTLRLRLWGGPPERGDRQTVVVGIGEARLRADIPTAGWTSVDLALPARLTPGEISVTLETTTFVPGAGGGGDQRALGVAVGEVALRP